MTHRRSVLLSALVLCAACGEGLNPTLAPDPVDNTPSAPPPQPPQAPPQPPPPSPLQAVELSFVSGALVAYAGETIAPVVVEARLAGGERATTFRGPVTIGFGEGTGPATLTGTKTLTAVSGVATFNDLRISAAGTYQLEATAPPLRAALSATVVVLQPRVRLLAYASCLKWEWTPSFDDVCVSSGITIRNVDGSEREMPVPGPGIAYDPAWSPDGQRLAFTGHSHCDADDFATCRSEIYTINVDGSGLTRLTTLASVGHSFAPSWSPDGARLMFTLLANDKPAVYVMSANGGQPTPLGSLEGYQPAWSPDGQRIAYAANDLGRNSIYLANADGSDPIRLTTPAALAGESASHYSPTWSPDGRRIAFVANRTYADGHGSCQVFVMGVDGSGMVQLTNDGFCAHAPAWSPDGTLISYNGQGDSPGFIGIKLMNPDGSGTAFLQRTYGWASRVAWAPLSVR